MFISDDYAQPGGTFYARGYLYDALSQESSFHPAAISNVYVPVQDKCG